MQSLWDMLAIETAQYVPNVVRMYDTKLRSPDKIFHVPKIFHLYSPKQH